MMNRVFLKYNYKIMQAFTSYCSPDSTLLFFFSKSNFKLRTNNENVSLEENFEIIDMLILFS